jgi:hypothetical protein
MTETTAVEYRVLNVEPVKGAGRLIALATVEVTIAGVALTLQGCQIRVRLDGRLDCLAPQWRHPRTGKWLPCLLLPEELTAAIADEVLTTIRERTELPTPAPGPNSGSTVRSSPRSTGPMRRR